MKQSEEKHLIIRVTKYALDNPNFKLTELQSELGLTDEEYYYVRNSLIESDSKQTDNPNHILVLYSENAEARNIGNLDIAESYYALLPNAFYNYIDYLEIKEARKQAVEARKYAIIAIWVSAVALFFGAGQFIIEMIQLFKHN